MNAQETRSFLFDLSMMENHLQHNHYPPFDIKIAPVALKIVERIAKAIISNDSTIWKDVVECPNGNATVEELYEAFHLRDFVDSKLSELME
jgi:hypothetical protein